MQAQASFSVLSDDVKREIFFEACWREGHTSGRRPTECFEIVKARAIKGGIGEVFATLKQMRRWARDAHADCTGAKETQAAA